MLLGPGFFVRSIQSVNAAPSPKEFIEEGLNKIGKYQMSLGSDDKGNMRMLIWDTETGKSQLFAEKIVDNVWVIAPSNYTIPNHTLGK